MKLLGVDYGTKRVGIAIADSETNMAFPKCVLEVNKDFFEEFRKLIKTEGIERIVLGESKDFKGIDNPVMASIRQFKDKIEQELKVEVVLHPEFLTSEQAKRLQGENTMLDASAAAIILQAHLDRYNQ